MFGKFDGDAGNYVIDVTERPELPPECPASNTLFGQPPDNSIFGATDERSGFVPIDDSSGVEEPICAIQWWGISRLPNAPSCIKDPDDFEIKFLTYGGSEVCSYRLTPATEDTGRTGLLEPLFKYEAVLDPCCELEKGVVQILGLDAGQDCWHYRMTSATCRGTNYSICLLGPPPPCIESLAPVAVQLLAEVEETETVDLTTNRMIGLVAGDPGRTQVIRIELVDLPGAFAVWNGTQMWVTAPRDVCSLPGVSDPAACTTAAGPAPLFRIAGLTCDPGQAHATDWSLEGEFYVQHAGIVPDGLYDVQVTDTQCDLTSSASFSAVLAVRNSVFGDISGLFDPASQVWVAPDGGVDIFPDIVSMIAGFGNQPGNPTKLRADVEPCILDFKINISDITFAIDGFRGLPFPFEPGALDCPPEPCATDGTVSEASSARQTIKAEAARSQRGSSAILTLVPSSTHVVLGETVSVDVFAEGLVDLRSYQVTLAINGDSRTSREQAALRVDERRADYVFAGRESLSAVDRGGLRLAGALVSGAVEAEGRVYLGTFIFPVPQEATSSLIVGVATDDGASRFTDSANRVLQFEAVSVTITLAKPQGRAVER